MMVYTMEPAGIVNSSVRPGNNPQALNTSHRGLHYFLAREKEFNYP